jgi:hypothetical protein
MQMDKWFRIGQGRGGVPAVVVFDRIFINPAQLYACLEEVST